jgi:hypothetical protein
MCREEEFETDWIKCVPSEGSEAIEYEALWEDFKEWSMFLDAYIRCLPRFAGRRRNFDVPGEGVWNIQYSKKILTGDNCGYKDCKRESHARILLKPYEHGSKGIFNGKHLAWCEFHFLIALFFAVMKEITRRLTLTMPSKDETMRLLWNEPGLKRSDIPTRDGYLLILVYAAVSVRALAAEEKARIRSQEIVWSMNDPCEKFLPRSSTVAPDKPHGNFWRR